MLHFNGLEPIDFKGHLCEAKLDAEKKLRLQKTKFETEEQIRAADDILASCFEDEFARNFIREKLSTDDKVVLKTYLLRGETGINQLSKATDGAIEKYVTRALEGIVDEAK
jgi:hypothetical protein